MLGLQKTAHFNLAGTQLHDYPLLLIYLQYETLIVLTHTAAPHHQGSRLTFFLYSEHSGPNLHRGAHCKSTCKVNIRISSFSFC